MKKYVNISVDGPRLCWAPVIHKGTLSPSRCGEPVSSHNFPLRILMLSGTLHTVEYAPSLWNSHQELISSSPFWASFCFSLQGFYSSFIRPHSDFVKWVFSLHWSSSGLNLQLLFCCGLLCNCISPREKSKVEIHGIIGKGRKTTK